MLIPPPVASWPVVPAIVQNPFQAPSDKYAPGHRGVDLAAAPGDEVRAALSGVVSFVGSVAGTPVISLDHQGGFRTTYEPVVSDLRPGTVIVEGDPIGVVAVGAGHCGGLPGCLHWGLLTGSQYLDPAGLFGHSVLLPVGPEPRTGHQAQTDPQPSDRTTSGPVRRVSTSAEFTLGAATLLAAAALGLIGLRRLRPPT